MLTSFIQSISMTEIRNDLLFLQLTSRNRYDSLYVSLPNTTGKSWEMWEGCTQS